MAGLAALMTRKKRDRRRELEMKSHVNLDSASIAELSGKEAQAALQAKAAHETIKKMLIGKELLHQKSKQQSFDAMSQMSYNDNEDDNNKGGFSNAYSPIYIGLILMCIGIVITFVGLGEKGFKTLELKLIGPILCLVGFTSITLKIIQCTFPQLFHYPNFLKKRKNDSAREKSSLVEKGEGDGATPTVVRGRKPHKERPPPPEGAAAGDPSPSPRVTLQSNKKSRPRSTIPNYIEDSSEDSDDFDTAGRSKSKGRSKTPVTKMGPGDTNSVVTQQPHSHSHRTDGTESRNQKPPGVPIPLAPPSSSPTQTGQNTPLPPLNTTDANTNTTTTNAPTDPSSRNKPELVLSPRGLLL